VRIDPDEIRKKGRVPKNASVFFTIFQTFMSGPKDEEGNPTEYYGDYPQDFFDFIIIDECHRGGAKDESSWRDVLNYFSPAVQLGLTATPKRKDNVDTYEYFGEPVYSYTLKEGINDGFLTPFKVYPIVGTMDEYLYTPGDGVVVQGDPEAGKVYKESDFNRVITIPKREERRVHYWMDRINPQQKTIVFCATQEHAGTVRDLVNQYAVKRGWTNNTDYCVRITANDGKAGERDLNIFKDNEKTIPTILTTSRKLSTGVDARNVRNIVLMRPCNNMIEFKQIIGRGTRLFEGKDFFTVFDFVKAHHNFSDPEWDGEPLPPGDICGECGDSPCSCDQVPCSECGFSPCHCDQGLCSDCGKNPCLCEKGICDKCGNTPCSCASQPCSECGNKPCTCVEKIIIKLSDGKTRQIQHISSVMYWSPEGKPITAKEFVERMYDDLPQFFESEDHLREIWSDPTTREKILHDLSEVGYDQEKIDSMKELIDAKDSDVYDVLAYVAYAAETRTRLERVETAKPAIAIAYSDYKQQQFIDFVLSKYVDGIAELSPTKMRSLIELKYHTISDAAAEFGSPATIRETFVGFQKHLYNIR
jgi:type I restriction enzyme R subunit